MTKSPKSLSAFLEKRGVATTEELVRILGNRVQIKREIEAGELHALGSGIYASPSLDPVSASIIAASRFYPEAVISNLTALVIHGLSDESIARIDVDIPSGKSLKNKLLRVHRVAPYAFAGKSSLKYQEHSIRVYDFERSLCEAFRIDSDGPIFYKALKRAISKGHISMFKIAKYDRALGTEVVARIRQELADG